MTTLQSEDCQTNELNDLFPTSIESLRFPLDNSMRIVFTGYYNGFNVEVRSTEEMALLYHMGCFGKGSASRSRPSAQRDSIRIMRRRQFSKRSYWFKKFGGSKGHADTDSFFKEVDALTARIIEDGVKKLNKDVIDLVSSDENNSDDDDHNSEHNPKEFQNYDKDDIVVIVPNSGSEDEDYFAGMKPKCCVNKIKLEEKLMLSPPEAFFLLYGLGCLQIISLQNHILNIEECWELFTANDAKFISKYVVYHYYKSKGYVVKPGIKFGGDYLLYREGPGKCHADYIVVIKSEDSPQIFDWISILGHIRMANTTVKEVLIVEVINPKKPTKMPEGLRNYSVQEILLNRNFHVTLNEDD